MKKFVKIIGGIILAKAAYLGYTYKKGRDFQNSMDLSEGSLDACTLIGGKGIHSGKVPMQDMKLGAYFGGMEIDLSEVIAEKTQYDLDIEVRQGMVSVIIPRNFHLNLTDRSICSGIVDETDQFSEKDVTLSVFARIICGGLCIKNPPIEADAPEEICLETPDAFEDQDEMSSLA